MNSAVLSVLLFQGGLSLISAINVTEEIQAIQAQADSLFGAGVVLISNINEQIQAIQAQAPSDPILEAGSVLISNINDQIQAIQAQTQTDATLQSGSAVISNVIEPIPLEIQSEAQTDAILPAGSAIINEPMQEIQDPAQSDAILEAGSATISDELIQQIQAQADAMMSDNKTIFPVSCTTVKATQLSIVVYSKSDTKGTKIPITSAKQIYTLTSFDPRLRTIIYIFGWTSGVDKEGTVTVKDGILTRTDVNVLILDWSVYTQTLNYFDAYKSVQKTGEFLGQFLADLILIYPADKITVVGHSLGAHVGGFAGRYIKGAIPVIIALDPAGILYCQYQKYARLNTGDAKYVMVLHTSCLGAKFSMGHSDFWPNGGFYQKGCVEFMCSHKRAMYLYVDSLSDILYGTKCKNFWMYAYGLCRLNVQKKFGGIQVDITAKGNYSLFTNSKPPYGREKLH